MTYEISSNPPAPVSRGAVNRQGKYSELREVLRTLQVGESVKVVEIPEDSKARKNLSTSLSQMSTRFAKQSLGAEVRFSTRARLDGFFWITRLADADAPQPQEQPVG